MLDWLPLEDMLDCGIKSEQAVLSIGRRLATWAVAVYKLPGRC
jgi:hypothetical protein